MDFTDTPAEAAFRAEARAWLAAHAPAHELAPGVKYPDTDEADRGRAWMRELHAGGWAGLTFPKQIQPAQGAVHLDRHRHGAARDRQARK